MGLNVQHGVYHVGIKIHYLLLVSNKLILMV